MYPVTHHTSRVGEVDVFYRQAGPADAPVLLMLHGFPSSSHQFRNLIPLLSDRFRVIAPDLPGFGATVAPGRDHFDYTFDNLADAVEGLIEQLDLQQFALYLFDYGAPVGFRVALNKPDRITGIITQNGNAYEEGLTPAWAPLRAYWSEPSAENREALRALLAPETTAWQYHQGAPEDRINRIAPEAIAHDQGIIDRDHEIQLDLFRDYGSNVARYPEWQAFLREYQPPVLAIWGANDPFFGPDGARAFARDVTDTRVVLLDAGHFPLETHAEEVANAIREFLAYHRLALAA